MAFNVTTTIRQLTKEELKKMILEFANSSHINYRQSKIEKFRELGLLDEHFLVGFLVDKEERGLQYHLINGNALIYVVSMDLKIITILGARTGNIYRYYNQLGLKIDKVAKFLLDTAYQNCIKYDLNTIESSEGVSIKGGDIEVRLGKRKTS